MPMRLISFSRDSRIQKQNSRMNGNESLDTLEFEKCEDRNMLSASTSFDTGLSMDLGLERMITRYIAENANLDHLQRGANDLLAVRSEQQDNQTMTVFQQTIDGIPVHGAYVTFVQDVRGKVVDVNNGAHLYLVTLDAVAELDFDAAADMAHATLHTKHEISSTGDLVWFSSGDTAQLAWRVDSSMELIDETLELTTVLDADTGQLLSQVQSPSVIDAAIDGQETGVFPRIVINDTIGPQGSRDYAAPFDAVVSLALGCTGTLMAENVVISARHCGAGAGSTIEFGDNSNSPDFTVTVQSSFLPAGSGSLLDGGDVAILTLNQNVPSNIATPMRFIDATNDLEGMTAALAGYGYNGVGSTGHGFSSDGQRWGGENIIDRYGTPASSSGSNIISTDFDNENGTSNTIGSGSATPLQYEATTAPGDSGGPVLVQQGVEWLIAGVLSGGTTSTSVYGDISWWTGTAIYRTDIEARGGVFATNGLGNVNLDQTSYFVGDTVQVTVVDDNAVGSSLNVTATSDSGDSETVALSNGGSGSVYTGSITTSDSGVSTGDGTLQVTIGDDINVSYQDVDDGTGNSNTVNDTASIIEPSEGVLVAIDFDQTGSSTPTNWLLISGGSNATFSNLNGEDGNPSTFDLQVQESPNNSWSDFAVTPAANTIPQHSNNLANVNGQIYTGADPLVLTYSDLTPQADYEVYVMAAEGFFSSIQQRITITGDGTPVTFDQNFVQNQLFVNDQLGDSTRQLSEYAQVITADSSGEIVINVDPIGGTSDVVLAGLAIFEVPVDNVVVPSSGKTADGVVTGGQLSDLFLSDDQYRSFDPEPTANPFKQKIEYIVQQSLPTSNPDSFGFRLEARLLGGPSGDVLQGIHLFNYDTSSFELVDSRAVSTTDTVVEYLDSGNLDRFTAPGTNESTAMVTFDSFDWVGTPFFWSVEVDQMVWIAT
ncbi:MAG: trypsin-like serine protease [Pirellulaceae bacterium]